MLQRLQERKVRVEQARDWAASLAQRVPLCAAVVVGSYARGDFNKWSDLDVLVIVDDLPEGLLDRMALLDADAPAGLQPVGWTFAELAQRRRRGDPLAVQADTVGCLVYGKLPAA